MLSFLHSPTLTLTTGKTIALTRLTFVGKVMSLLFDMLSRLVMTFLPRSKFLLISWLQSPSEIYHLVLSLSGMDNAAKPINTNGTIVHPQINNHNPSYNQFRIINFDILICLNWTPGSVHQYRNNMF